MSGGSTRLRVYDFRLYLKSQITTTVTIITNITVVITLPSTSTICKFRAEKRVIPRLEG